MRTCFRLSLISKIIGGILLLPWLFVPEVPAQNDTLEFEPERNALRAEDIVFSVDTGRLQVISAGRISKNLEELPLTVYVISHEEILRNRYNSLTDVLRSLPGIITSQPGYGELGESFQIWDLTGNLYTKILVNGLPVKPSVVSGMPIGNQLPIRQAEKIEVIYGTSSAIYGADAVSGVINIITKKAERGTFVRGDIGLGKNGYNDMNFFLGGKAGRNNNILQYSVYGSRSEYPDMDIQYPGEEVYNPLNYYHQRGKKFELGGEYYEALEIDENLLESHGVDPEDFKEKYYGERFEGSVTRPGMEALGTASHMLGLQMEFRGIGFSWHNMYRRAHSSIGLSPVFYKYNNPQNFWGEKIDRITLSYEKDFERFYTSTRLYNLVYRMDNNSSQGVTFLPERDKAYRYSASNDLMLEQAFSASPARNLELVAGFSYRQSGNLPVTNYLKAPFDKKDYKAFSKRVHPRDTLLGRFGLNPVNFNNLSGFAQFYYVLNKFRFLGGIRYDRNTLYGNRFSPQLGILFNSGKKLSMHLSVGTAYKAPPSSIAFQSQAHLTGDGKIRYRVVPNEHLKPEKFNTIEYGLSRRVFRKAMLKQTFFYYRITDHIMPQTVAMDNYPYPNPAGDSVKTWINNMGTVSHVVGSQTTLYAKDLISSIHLDAELSLSFLNRQDHLPDVVDIVKEYLTLMPRHSGKLKLSLMPVDNLYIHVESQWMSKWLRVLIPFKDIYNDIFRDTDGYYALNALAGFDLSRQLSTYIKVTNLFDEKYGNVNAFLLDENLVYNPQLRRSIQVGLSYKLN